MTVKPSCGGKNGEEDYEALPFTLAKLGAKV
jgi:hypothetical protein